ncbi:MAG TPA: tetratricopeptide repeat protein [Burkholderiales bacterium]|nr:tetratricopeptide repeat protein [Burkholderiales bacterium]
MAGLYVVGVWLVMQVADIVFPAWGIPDAAIRVLLWAALLGFPVALAFGWVFQITPEGIQRTRPEWSDAEIQAARPLGRFDYLLLAAFMAVIAWIGYDATARVLRTAPDDGPRPAAAEVIENSVAVLPFASLSSDPEHEYFADGISEEILGRLSAFGELTVIARTSSFAFKDSGYDIPSISGLLGAQYLLQGSVRRDGQQLRIAAQLVDRNGVQVWSNSFDRELGGIFALQDEIAESVAKSIVPRIAPPAASQRRPDVDAYHEYLIGRELMTRRITAWWWRGPERFTRAIELDPQFAAAYAARAICLVRGAPWAEDYEAQLDQAQQDIDAALVLDSANAQAYAAQALLNEFRDPTNYAEREALLRRALALDPNSVDALNWLASAVNGQGRHAEAIEIYERATRIDPLAPAINANLAMWDARSGRAEDAERRLRRLLDVPQPSGMIFGLLFELQFNSGRLVEALQTVKRAMLHISPAQGRAYGSYALTQAYGTLGMAEQAEYWLARNEREWPEVYQTHFYRAMILGHVAGQRTYVEAVADFEAVLDFAGVSPETLNPENATAYGMLLALAGEHDRALRVFEAVIDPEVARQGLGGPGVYREADARHALAWSYQQTGVPEKATALLELLAQDFRSRQAAGHLHLSDDLAEFACNALLRGDTERALDLLEQAEAAGWRGYYAALQDPRWDAVREAPQFKAIMARVKSDLDGQLAQVEAIDAEDDFIARLDAAIALQAGDGPSAGEFPPQNR